LDDLVDALETVIDADMNEGMALFDCHSGRLGGLERGKCALGLPIYLKAKSTLDLLALRR
jgi:hypothetical protein